jgi:hypothetical protein
LGLFLFIYFINGQTFEGRVIFYERNVVKRLDVRVCTAEVLSVGLWRVSGKEDCRLHAVTHKMGMINFGERR